MPKPLRPYRLAVSPAEPGPASPETANVYFVYVLKSISQGKLYIGSSSSPQKRLKEHNSGKTRSTKPFAPYELIYTEQLQNKHDALVREKQIKNSGKIRTELKKGTYHGPIV